MRRLVIALACLAGAAHADLLVLPPSVERAGVIEGRYIVEPRRTGTEILRLEWTDALGRLVARTSETIALQGVGAIPVRLDASRAVAMDNRVRATLGDSVAEARFIARPAPGWEDFRVIMYQDHARSRLASLAAVGVDGVRVMGRRIPFTPPDIAPSIADARAVDLRWYVENIATDFYSPYHMWTPEHPTEVHFRFLEAQRRHAADPADLAVFERTPSLSDPAWQARIASRLADTARAHGDFRPYYYSLGDEPGIADLAAAWDFDRSPVALADFRAWLRARHADLAALNAAWGSRFAAWDDLMPEGTNAAMARTDGNYAAWNAHKEFMDERFADALRMGRAALHDADPTALAGIEGGQIPGWGGWDYARVAPAVDVMEIYPAGENVDIARDMNPGLITLTTLSGAGPADRRQAWRAVLQGAAGMILWDEGGGMVAADGGPGPWAASLQPIFTELAGGLGAWLIAHPPERAPVAVLYSPASFRLSWLLQHRAEGDAWTRRTSEIENQDTEVRVAMRQAASDLASLGLPPRWMTETHINAGALARRGIKLIILPHALALSDATLATLRAYIAGGGAVLTDGPAGTHDEQLRPRIGPVALGQPLLGSGRRAVIAAAYADQSPLRVAASAAAAPTITLRGDDGIWVIGALAGHDATSIPDAPAEIDIPTGLFVRDLRADGPWRPSGPLLLKLDAEGPALFAIARTPPPAPTLPPLHTIGAGETAVIALGPAAPGTVLHIEVRDPAGRRARIYSGNIVLKDGRADWAIPFALDDPPGEWSITLQDPIGGGRASGTVLVGR